MLNILTHEIVFRFNLEVCVRNLRNLPVLDYKPGEDTRCCRVQTTYLGYCALAYGPLVLLFKYGIEPEMNNPNLNAEKKDESARDMLDSSDTNKALHTPALVLTGHRTEIVALGAVGRKLVSCDASGVCCFWLGPGVPRAITRVAFNAGSRVSGVWADVGAAGWCFLLSAAGEFGWIGKNNQEMVIARLTP